MFLLFTTSGLFLAGCSDEFLQEKRLYNGGGWDIFDNPSLAQARVDYLYQYSLPDATTSRSKTHLSSGVSDETSTMTWEYGGSPKFGNEASPLSVENKNLFDWFGTAKSAEGVYMHIRNANVSLYGLANSSLREDVTRSMRGEVYFWRAWNYMLVLQYYGGVPIIDYLQDPILGTNGGDELKVNRSTTHDTYNFIIADLDLAIELLPASVSAAEGGRLTKAAAAAFKGRMALLWASPLFNREDDAARWTAAYNVCKDAYDITQASGHSLVTNNANENARQWEQMFLKYDSPEAVMVTLYNSSTHDDLKKNNGWESGCRPSTNLVTGGDGGRAVPAEMIDLWPMADGKAPGESSFSYDELAFFKNRDPRFYRTFAFPGAVWPFQGNTDFTTWHYIWYHTQANIDNQRNTGYSGNYHNSTPASAAIVRKKTSPNASYNNADFFKLSNLPHIEIRMGEVVLNLAEAAAGAGDLGKGYEYLRMIRERVYGADSPYAASDFGLADDLKNNRGKLLGAILYERQIELAYEGKRFEDMRRWLLVNGGVNVEPAYMNGNTFTFLGYDPTEATMVGKRRHGLLIAYPTVVAGGNASTADKDPLATQRPTGLNPDSQTFHEDMETLVDFYTANFMRQDKDNLDNADNRTMFWDNKYYFLGLSHTNCSSMPYLWQNKGYLDHYTNPGLFDIFSNTLPEKTQDEYYGVANN